MCELPAACARCYPPIRNRKPSAQGSLEREDPTLHCSPGGGAYGTKREDKVKTGSSAGVLVCGQPHKIEIMEVKRGVC